MWSFWPLPLMERTGEETQEMRGGESGDDMHQNGHRLGFEPVPSASRNLSIWGVCSNNSALLAPPVFVRLLTLKLLVSCWFSFVGLDFNCFFCLIHYSDKNCFNLHDNSTGNKWQSCLPTSMTRVKGDNDKGKSKIEHWPSIQELKECYRLKT